MARNRLAFAAFVIVQLWFAHAIAFFVHEYGHSLTAWALGFKSNPWLLNFGDLSLPNLVIMSGIDEKVDYGPIFGSGHGPLASLIAAAGVLSNAVLYVVAAIACHATGRKHPGWSLLFFWIATMSAGNFIAYVPVRTFSPIDDMHTVEQGLNAAPWMVLLVLGIPFLAGLLDLLFRLLPQTRRALFADNKPRQSAIVLLCTFVLFVFFAAAGFESGVGPIARILALVSIFAAFPLAAIVCWPHSRRPVTD